MAGAISSRSGRRLRSKALARRTAAARRRLLLSAVGAISVVALAPLTISSVMGWEVTVPGLEAAKSFLALMDDRSPGDRTAAELTKTKQKALSERPTQRALGKMITPPPEFETALAPPPPTLEELPPFAAALTDLGPLLAMPPAPPPGGGITTLDSPPGGGGGGGGGGTPPDTPQTPENPPPPVVPEPGTWATMLLGFALTGWLLRRRRRAIAVSYWA